MKILRLAAPVFAFLIFFHPPVAGQSLEKIPGSTDPGSAETIKDTSTANARCFAPASPPKAGGIERHALYLKPVN